MTLQTAIIRDGQPMLIPWEEFHVASMIVASAMDSGKGPWPENSRKGITGTDDTTQPIVIDWRTAFMLTTYPIIAMTPLNDGPYTLKAEYTFLDRVNSEIFVLMPGDVLEAYRGL